MSWKEVLKPNKEKATLTIIILLFFPFPYWNGIVCEQCMDEVCVCPNTDFGGLIGWYFTWGSSENTLSSTALMEFLSGFLVIGLPVSYFLSCLIIFAYNRYRGKKKWFQ
ncbi:MAG: hypothetical protein NT129_05375 [Candidatus Aenigmarchaeota archaeon]|nr:hypothetical protein [Candidatus Aenigmarchaeota archaeon]